MKLRSSAVFAAVFAMFASSAAIAQAAVPPLTQNYLAGSWYDNAQCKGTPFFVFDNAGNVTINEAPGSTAKANYSILGTEEVLMHSATGQFSVNIRPSNDRLLLMNDPTSGNSYEPGYRCQVPYPTAATAPAPSVLPQAASPQPAPATPAGPPAFSGRLMVGNWAIDGDCALSTNYYANGTYLSTAGETGTWTVSQDVLAMLPTGADFFDAVTLFVKPVSNDELNVNNNAFQGVLKRCP